MNPGEGSATVNFQCSRTPIPLPAPGDHRGPPRPVMVPNMPGPSEMPTVPPAPMRQMARRQSTTERVREFGF